MLNLFSISSSVLYQFLVLESPLFQVIFMKNHTKNPLFEPLCYNHKGLELFLKMNFESFLVSDRNFHALYIFFCQKLPSCVLTSPIQSIPLLFETYTLYTLCFL